MILSYFYLELKRSNLDGQTVVFVGFFYHWQKFLFYIFVPVGNYMFQFNNKKHYNKMWNMFKVNNEDPNDVNDWCLYC